MKHLRSRLGEWFEAIVFILFFAAMLGACGVIENLPLDEWLSR